MKLTSGKLQDIETMIELVKKEKTNKLNYFLNRWSMPSKIFTSTKDWLKILSFLKKQEIEKLKFFEGLKKK